MTITQKLLQEQLLWDPDMLRFRRLTKKPGRLIGSVAGAQSSSGYRYVEIDGKAYGEHRLVWLYHYGHLPEQVIDHKDGNPGNNALENLRSATQQQNCRNKKKRDGSSQYKGVRRRASGKYEARIYNGAHSEYLGVFDLEADARDAYRQKAAEMFGAFANFGDHNASL
jgi:hypothetical protein